MASAKRGIATRAELCAVQPAAQPTGHGAKRSRSGLGYHVTRVLEPAKLQDFVERPEGRYVAGRCWLTFCKGMLTGVVVWGSPTSDDVDAFIKTSPATGSPLARPRPRYLDVRALDVVDQGSVTKLAKWLVGQAPFLRSLITRAAVVSRAPLGRAITTGLFDVSAQHFELEYFSDPAPALAWLGSLDSRQLADDIDAASARVAGTTPVVRELRAYLASHVRDAGLANAARELGCSSRALQRKLRDERTSFQRELDHARVEAAKSRLRTSDVAIAGIAREIGTSPRSLFTIFRRLTGQTPLQWRRAGEVTVSRINEPASPHRRRARR